jgi:hypothetical protein
MWGRSIDDTGYDQRVLEMAWGIGNIFLASPSQQKAHEMQVSHTTTYCNEIQ